MDMVGAKCPLRNALIGKALFASWINGQWIFRNPNGMSAKIRIIDAECDVLTETIGQYKNVINDMRV